MCVAAFEREVLLSGADSQDAGACDCGQALGLLTLGRDRSIGAKLLRRRRFHSHNHDSRFLTVALIFCLESVITRSVHRSSTNFWAGRLN